MRPASLTVSGIHEAKGIVPAGHGLWNMARETFRQVAFNPFNIGFSLLMPVFMYVMFGANQPYSRISVGSGNVSATILASMTLFGVLLSAASLGAGVSLERTQGIGRLYALTPLSATWQIVARLISSIGVALLVIVVAFVAGGSIDAEMTPGTWIQTALLILLLSTLGAAIGFGCGFAVRSDGAFAANSAVIVLSAFGSGMTVPLEQMGHVFQSLAPWMPLWGANQMVLLPLTGWDAFRSNMLINVVVWTGFFIALAMWGLGRDTRR